MQGPIQKFSVIYHYNTAQWLLYKWTAAKQ